VEHREKPEIPTYLPVEAWSRHVQSSRYTLSERESIHNKAAEFFESLWKQGDFWDFEKSHYEQEKYAAELKFLEGRRYGRVLEIGCGAGEFTRGLTAFADTIVALDISATAIEKARKAGLSSVDFRAINIMDYSPEFDGPWDLIVFNETICYLGWLYPFFDVAWLASELFRTTKDNGWCLMTNTFGLPKEYLLRQWLIETYRDLFVNVGYRLHQEDVFRGVKNGMEIQSLMSLFQKTSSPATDSRRYSSDKAESRIQKPADT
jgi:SAM-dependent methyltransferase